MCSSFTDGEIGLHKGHEGNAGTGNRNLEFFCLCFGVHLMLLKRDEVYLGLKRNDHRGFMEKVSRKKQCLWPTDVSWHEIQGVVGSGLGAMMCFKLCVPNSSN